MNPMSQPSNVEEVTNKVVTKELVKQLVSFVVNLDMVTGVETEERDRIETAIIEGLKTGIRKTLEICQLYPQPLPDEELERELKEIVLEVRQYLCNTEFAPEPFKKPVDAKVLTIEFPKKLLALLQRAKQTQPLDKELREKIQAWIDNRFGVPNTVNLQAYLDFYGFILALLAKEYMSKEECAECQAQTEYKIEEAKKEGIWMAIDNLKMHHCIVDVPARIKEIEWLCADCHREVHLKGGE